jgi:PAS domain S-box-containing protein
MDEKDTDLINTYSIVKTLISAIEQTADNVMITDKAGTIVYVNPAFQKTTGYWKLEVLGRTPAILKSGVHGDEYYKELWSTILSGKVFRAETTNKNKKGEYYIADQTITPLTNESGEITNFVSIWKDITHKVKR